MTTMFKTGILKSANLSDGVLLFVYIYLLFTNGVVLLVLFTGKLSAPGVRFTLFRVPWLFPTIDVNGLT